MPIKLDATHSNVVAIIKFNPPFFMSILWHVCGSLTSLQVQTSYDLRPSIVTEYFNRVVLNAPAYSWRTQLIYCALRDLFVTCIVLNNLKQGFSYIRQHVCLLNSIGHNFLVMELVTLSDGGLKSLKKCDGTTLLHHI